MGILVLALSSSQNLTMVVGLLVLASLAMIATASLAIRSQGNNRQELSKATTALTDQVSSGLAENTGDPDGPSASTTDPADFVRSLGDFASKLATLSPPVAILVVAVIPLFLAASLVGVQLFK